MKTLLTTVLLASAPVAVLAQQDVHFSFEGDVIPAPEVSGVTTGLRVDLVADPAPDEGWWASMPALPAEMPWEDTPLSNGAQEGVTGIEARERSDEPCHLVVTFGNLNGGYSVNGSASHRECSDKSNKRSGTDQSKQNISLSPDIDLDSLPDEIADRLPEGDVEIPALLTARVATSVQVCLNKTKIKGIFLDGTPALCQTSLGRQSEFCAGEMPTGPDRERRADGHNFFERPNCPGSNSHMVDDDWQTVASTCPDEVITLGQQTLTIGTGMVGLELHLTRQGDKEYVSGIRALCKRVTLNGLTVLPTAMSGPATGKPALVRTDGAPVQKLDATRTGPLTLQKRGD